MNPANTQAAESAPVFTHQIAGPTETSHGTQYFDPGSYGINVAAHPSHPREANLIAYIYGNHEYGNTSKKLTADQCEALARKLIDAAHHLRTTAGGAQ
jgi:hypothetical protein